MAIKESNILYLLKMVVPILNRLSIPWWLARGVLRNFYLTNRIGDQNSDLDFHVLFKDMPIIKETFVPLFGSEEYKVDEDFYKLAFYKPPEQHEFFVEFMTIFEYPEKPELVYHSRKYDKKYAPKICFSNYQTIQIEGIGVRVPANTEQYFLGTYGPCWWRNDPNDKNFNSTPDVFS